MQNDAQWDRVSMMDGLGQTVGSNECHTEDFIWCSFPEELSRGCHIIECQSTESSLS